MNIGPCCICERTGKTVRNLMMLPKRSPYGKGWGCVVCGLPSEGASAVICDACTKRYPEDAEEHLKYFCKPSADDYVSGRAPIAELYEQPGWAHDMSKHPEEEYFAF